MPRSSPELGDPVLVRAVQAGDGAAISQVLELHLPSLRNVARSRFGLSPEDTEDVLQEVRIAFWRAAPHFRGESSLQTYLIRILCCKCADYLRARERRAADPLPLRRGDVVGLDDPALEGLPVRLAVRAALARVSPRERQVLELYYLHRRSYREISEEMGIPVGTVGWMKAEALMKLRAALSQEGIG